MDVPALVFFWIRPMSGLFREQDIKILTANRFQHNNCHLVETDDQNQNNEINYSRNNNKEKHLSATC